MSVSAAAAASDSRLDGARSEPATPALGSHAAARSHSWHRRSALAGISAPRQTRNTLAWTRNTRAVAHRTEKEQPFVVVAAGSLVDLERGFLALAADSHHSASCLPPEARCAGRRRTTGPGARGRRA